MSLACLDRLRSFRAPLIAMGGGQDPEGKLLPPFITMAGGASSRIAVIPVASYVPEMGQIYRERLLRLGAGEITVVDPDEGQVNHPAVWDSIEACTGICVTGGDQKRLSRLLRDSLLLHAVVEALQAGIPVYCTSASTVALSDHMVGGLDDDDTLRIMPGLDILPGVTIETHVTQRGRLGRLEELLARKINPVIVGIDENTALQFIPQTTSCTVIGCNNVRIHGKRKWLLAPGDAFDFSRA
ncbi:MAG: cyanophycinase [Candidatus Xenobia bacterium]